MGDTSKRELLLKIAHMYYGLGMNQEQIAKQLFFSRSRISHLLSEAEHEGIVKYEVRNTNSRIIVMESFFLHNFDLNSIFIVDRADPAIENSHARVCTVAAEYLSTQLTDQTVLNFSRGQTTYGIVHSLVPIKRLPNMVVVQTEGLAKVEDPYLEQSDFVRHVSGLYGCKYHCMMLPHVFDSPELKNSILNQGGYRQIMEMSRKINLICASVLSVGQLRRWVPEEDYNWLTEHGVVGSIEGNYFDIDGNFIHAPINDRMVYPELDVIKNAEQVIFVATGNYKDKALLGALRTGIASTLVTDSSLANIVMQLYQQ